MNDIKAKDLRNSRKQTLLQMIERDQQGEDHVKTLELWSKAADKLIATALETIISEFEAPPQFSVIALGKLGGLELNYSSDVDLIYVFEGDFEKASKIASRFTRLLGNVTEDGFVFRVDNNLRPLGKDGNIVNTVDALERYYETTGHEWERQALIRARHVAGDKALSDEFVERISPFVFRRSIDIPYLKKIRATKLSLERTASNEGWRNIKLGPGGIREIEFVTQVLQLLHGGKIKDLRVTNTFDALNSLFKHKIISKKKLSELRSSYLLLRRAENMLQAKDDRQIHTLPKDDGDLKELSARLGFDSLDEFIDTLGNARKKVQEHFSELFDTSFEKMEILEAFQANLETCKSKEEVVDSLSWFKNHISKRIQELDLSGKLSIDEVSERLTCLAETIINEAFKIVKEALLPIYGKSLTEEGQEADLAVLGMGKLGTFEMDYASDLDLVFIYSGDGSTTGKKKITNHEYFTKVSQKLISMITLPTRYGKAYNIDTELRPSGNQGALVSSIEAFDRYHRREAGLWERQALLRARVIAGDITLGNNVSTLLENLVYDLPLPHEIKVQIDLLRRKVASENIPHQGRIDLKKGRGGIADIESVVHYMQLVNGGRDPSLREKKASYLIKAMEKASLLDKTEAETLSEAYILFRVVLSRARLFITHSTGTIDPASDYFQSIAESLRMEGPAMLKKLEELLDAVEDIYYSHLRT